MLGYLIFLAVMVCVNLHIQRKYIFHYQMLEVSNSRRILRVRITPFWKQNTAEEESVVLHFKLLVCPYQNKILKKFLSSPAWLAILKKKKRISWLGSIQSRYHKFAKTVAFKGSHQGIFKKLVRVQWGNTEVCFASVLYFSL